MSMRYGRRRGYRGLYDGATDAEIEQMLVADERADRETVKAARQMDRELVVSHQREAAHQRVEQMRDMGLEDDELMALAHYYDDQETLLRRRADARWRAVFERMNPGAKDTEPAEPEPVYVQNGRILPPTSPVRRPGPFDEA